MLGERSEQRGLWEADRLYLDHVGRDTFYGLLASLRGRLFRDADFAVFYCADNGRDSVPPSLLATALLLQTHDKVSDAEAKARADFDLRWKVALGIEVEDRPFAKSTLQMFRAQLILHEKVREVFESSLRLARESGYLKGRSMRVALDTTNILGRGAVKDTYNLLADGVIKLMRALAAVEQTKATVFKVNGRPRGTFQSSPSPKRGCNCGRLQSVHHVPAVSILTLSEERVQLRSTHSQKAAGSVFQSSPSPKRGCNPRGHRLRRRRLSVSILTLSEERVQR